VFELYKGVKLRSKAVKLGDTSTRPQRAALSKFAEVCQFIKPTKCRKYATSLAQELVDYTTQPEPNEALLETMSVAIDKIAETLANHLDRTEIAELLTAFLGNLANPSGAIRRAVCKSTIAVLRHYHAARSLFPSLVEILTVTSERATWENDTYHRTHAERQRKQGVSSAPSTPDMRRAVLSKTSPAAAIAGDRSSSGSAESGATSDAVAGADAPQLMAPRASHGIQGVAYCLMQCVRLSADLGANAPLHEHAIAPHVNFVAAFVLEFLLCSDHNVVALTLELLHVALGCYGGLHATWHACVSRCAALLCAQMFTFAVDVDATPLTAAAIAIGAEKARRRSEAP
jgi:hypothetical protein